MVSLSSFLLQEQGFAAGNRGDVDRKALATDVDRELDDALSTLWLVRENPQLCERLFDQVTDLLLERILLGLRTDLVAGHITASEFANQLAKLADQCRHVGLLTPEA